MTHPSDMTIDSEADLFAFCYALHDAGCSFHFEDSLLNSDGESEYSCFTTAQAIKIDALMERCFEVSDDPFVAGMWAIKLYYNDPVEMCEDLKEQDRTDLLASKPTPALIMRKLATADGRTELGTRVAGASGGMKQ